MKQVLVIFISVFLVGLIGVNVHAVTEVGGYLCYEYFLLNSTTNSYDTSSYAVLNFKGTVNDKVTGYLSLGVSEPDYAVKANYFYVTDKEKYGSYSLGSFYYEVYNLRLLRGAFQKLQSKTGIQFEYPCLEVLNLKFAYFPEEQLESGYSYQYDEIPSVPDNPLITKWEYYNAYAVGCDYKFEKVFIGINYIQPGVKPGKPEKAGYTLNVSVDFNPASKLYLHYGQDKYQNLKGVLGYSLGFLKIGLLIDLECSFLPDASSYGYLLYYQYSPKAGVYYRYIIDTVTTNKLTAAFSF
jgi:predicted porin